MAAGIFVVLLIAILVKLKRTYLSYFSALAVILLVVLFFFEIRYRRDAYVPSRQILQLRLLNDFYGDEDGIYVANPEDYDMVNTDGFPSRDFKDPGCADTMPRVVFLGDSYTWGAAADEGKSFVNLTDSAGYCTFNTGMPSTDPAQYAGVAKKYVPILQPDIVLLMFCMDNDVMDCERPLVPNHPIFYATDGVINGLLLDGYRPNTCPKEPFPSYEVGLDYLASHYLYKEESILGWTAIGTMFSKYLKESEFFGQWFNKLPYEEIVPFPEYAVTDIYLQKVQEVCDANNIPLWIFIIPSKAEKVIMDVNYYLNEVPRLFEEYRPEHIFCPTGLTLADYEPDPNAHLNNEGHGKVSDYIVRQLDSYFGK